jgi:hypothetical protein
MTVNDIEESFDLIKKNNKWRLRRLEVLIYYFF